MKNFLLFIICLLINISIINADEFKIGTITNISSEKEQTSQFDDKKELEQIVDIKVFDEEKTILQDINHTTVTKNNAVEINEKIVIHQLDNGEIYIVDKFRLPTLSILFLILFLLVIYLTGKQWFFAIIWLWFSLLVLIFFIAPYILAGHNPLLISLIGGSIIAFLSIYMAHWINKKTTIALISTITTLVIAVILSFIFVKLSRLAGDWTEDAFFLQMGSNININLQGLFLWGIIIGTLGLLDDITTTQVTAIFELKKANPKLTDKELRDSGFEIWKEHILSMINTLALAYAGASFPLFLMFTLNSSQAAWVIVNSAPIAEEIVRTITGSISLICAIPISTYLAVYSIRKFRIKN